MTKALQITLITTCVFIMFISSGVVSALGSSDITARPIPSTTEAAPGDTINIRVFLTNNAADSITIHYVGVHFDWMPSDGFFGYDLSDAPVTLAAGQSTPIGPISVAVASTADAGEHSYSVGIEGVEGSSTPFSWDSPASYITVTGSGSTTHPTANPSSTDGSTSLPPNLLIDIVLIVVIVIVVVFMLIFLKRGKRKPASTEPADVQAETRSTAPDEEPESGSD